MQNTITLLENVLAKNIKLLQGAKRRKESLFQKFTFNGLHLSEIKTKKKTLKVITEVQICTRNLQMKKKNF